MEYLFNMYDPSTGFEVVVKRGDLDDINDVMDLFYTFLHGCGYTYVEKVGVQYDNKDEKWTL